MSLKSTIDYLSTTQTTDALFGYLGLFLFNMIFATWSLLVMDNERPELTIVTSDLVYKQLCNVVYYVTS